MCKHHMRCLLTVTSGGGMPDFYILQVFGMLEQLYGDYKLGWFF